MAGMDYRTDPLAPFRERIIYPILIVAALCLTPLFINSFIEKRYGGAFSTLLVVVTYAIDAAAIRMGKRPPIPFTVLLVPMAVAVGVSVVVQGLGGALWLYPAAMACFFVLSRRTANICIALLLAGVAVMIYRYAGLGTAARFAGSFGLTVAVANCILSVVSTLQGELMHQAMIDPLTGAFNRRHMDRRLAEISDRHNKGAVEASILILDIDHFKHINDRLGHASGDIVLKKLVSIINLHTRKTDQLFRMGGEEFLLLLPETGEAEAMIVAENLRRAIAEIGWPENYPHVTISAGVSQHALNEKTDEWIKKADDALYRAKRFGRNNVVSHRSAA